MERLTKEARLAFKLGFYDFVKEALYLSFDPKVEALRKKRLAAKAAPATRPAAAPTVAAKATQVHSIVNQPAKRLARKAVAPASTGTIIDAAQQAKLRAAKAVRERLAKATPSTGVGKALTSASRVMSKATKGADNLILGAAKKGKGILKKLIGRK